MSQKNELDQRLVGINGLNPFIGAISSARSVMGASHVSQRLVINGATEKRIQTGVEAELGKYTLSVEMPNDGTILKVIERYPTNLGKESIAFNPEILVIYEIDETKEIDCFSIPLYKSMHQYFGFELKFNSNFSMLAAGNYIKKGTIFADTPAKTEDGGYKYGIELNMCLMSHPASSEDGVLISRDVLDRLKFKIYEHRVVEFGASQYPLNLYGTVDNYKPFPDIGDKVRSDGLLVAVRDYNISTFPVDIDIFSTMEVDHIFDKPIYARDSGGRVIDIKVITDDLDCTTTGMVSNLRKYSRGLYEYHKKIVDTYKEISYRRKKKTGSAELPITPEFHRLIVESMVVTDSEQKREKDKKLTKGYRTTQLDDYRVEFIIEYEITPDLGFKLSDSFGSKGVICQIAEPHEMPVDMDGNRADVVMDSGSVINRMNPARLYEMYFSAAARDTSKDIREMLGLERNRTYGDMTGYLMDLYVSRRDMFEKAWDTLLRFYEVLSPKQHMYFNSIPDIESIVEHLNSIIKEGIYLYMPTDNEPELVDMVKTIEKEFNPIYGPVSYIGNSGEKCVTTRSLRIAPLYMVLLEKIGDDSSSVSSGKLQHFGVLSPTIKSEKHAYPFRNSAVKTIGETEGRIYASYTGVEAVAELMDRNNTPMTHKQIVKNILSADKPTNIENAVDRTVQPLGGAKPIQLVSHISLCAGVKFEYKRK